MNGHAHGGAGQLLGREIDDLLLDLRGLTLVRDLLADRGASDAEIRAHSRELERRRTLLADLISGRDSEADAIGVDVA